MYTGQRVFSQLLDFLPKREFNKCVRRYQSNYRVRKVSCFDQSRCIDIVGLGNGDSRILIQQIS